MQVFVTGAGGLVGSALVPALVAAGHTVSALARSEKSTDAIKANGASQVFLGTITDRGTLEKAASKADGVVHLAFDTNRIAAGEAIQACEEDRQAIKSMCDALVSSTGESSRKKIFIGTTGLLGVKGEDEKASQFEMAHLPRYLSDRLVASYAEKDLLYTHTVRLSPVTHGPGREHPFIFPQIKEAKEKGAAAYIGDGTNAWNAVHIDDAAQVYVLALTGKAPNGEALHAVAEEAITGKEIAEFIAEKLKIGVQSIAKEDAMQRYGCLGMMMTLGGKRTAKYTQEWLGWKPTKYGLFKEMEGYAW